MIATLLLAVSWLPAQASAPPPGPIVLGGPYSSWQPTRLDLPPMVRGYEAPPTSLRLRLTTQAFFCPIPFTSDMLGDPPHLSKGGRTWTPCARIRACITGKE